MKKFIGKNFLLDSKTAKNLYHNTAKKMPIIDYHCHINPQEIAEDKQFTTITEAWLGGDHYKWRAMRNNGVSEKYITGDASDFEKFYKWAQTLEKLIGNPLYHWSHLELQRYFDYYGFLNSDTVYDVYELCNKKLAEQNMSVRGIIAQSNVDIICTTDDPIDDLHWHKEIAKDHTFETKVLPTWRPDKAMNIEKPDYIEYIHKLATVSNLYINNYGDLLAALNNRLDYFDSCGCNLSDHGLDFILYHPLDRSGIEAIFAKRLAGEEISQQEAFQFKTAFMEEMGKQYSKRNWIMQLHFGCIRNNNSKMFDLLGPDTGFDAINTGTSASQVAGFLNCLYGQDSLPKTILYSLNPNDDALIGSILGCFSDSTAVGKVQQGSAWWFNDHKTGMVAQMTSLANLGLLGNFLGMLTDSRSFLSYTRHEYFRRILCNFIGELVENGEFPNHNPSLEKLVKDICYNNTKNYFNF